MDRRHFQDSLGWFLFSFLLIVNLWYHQMWFDELQAWSLTRAKGLFGLLSSSEGHPMMWYFLLWPLTQISSNPGLMKVVTGVMGIGSLGLVWKYSPFSLAEKVLMCLSYQVGFNFFVLSRSYAPGVFLSFLFVALIPRFRDRPWLGWLILAFLSNVHLFFALVGFCLAVLWLHSSNRRDFLTKGIGIYLLGIAYLLFCVAGQGTKGTIFFTPFGRSASTVGFGLFPISYPFDVYYWNTKGEVSAGVVLLFLFLIAVGVLFRRYPLARNLLLGQTAFFTLFFTFLHEGHSWHVGVLFVSLLCTFWLCCGQDIELNPRWLFGLLLCVQAVFGAKAMVASKIVPLAANQETAELLDNLRLRDSFVVGYPQFPTTAICAYFDRPLYSVETGTERTFCDWTAPWLGVDELIEALQFELQKRGTLYLVLPTHEAEDFRQRVEKVPIITERIGATSGSMVEHYVVFRLEQYRTPTE